MSDRGHQEKAKQKNPAGYETQKQKPVKQPQPMNQPNAPRSVAPVNAQNNNDTRNQSNRVYVTQDPHANRAGGGQQPQQQQQYVVVMMPATSNYNDPNRPDPNRPTSDAGDASTEWASSSFSDKRIRQAFIQKVYLILTAMLLVTVVFICIFIFVQPVKDWVHQYYWVVWISIGVYLVVYIVLVCCDSVRRSYPTNYICLIVFNLAFSYVCAAVSSYYDLKFVLIAIGITTLVCVGISIFAIQTKIDFTLCAALLFVLSMVLVIFGFVVMLVFLFAGRNYILTCVYGAIAALVFSLFLAYDTQVVIGGRKYQLSPEEYIFGALQLYMDVGTIYMIILSFFSCNN